MIVNEAPGARTVIGADTWTCWPRRATLSPQVIPWHWRHTAYGWECVTSDRLQQIAEAS